MNASTICTCGLIKQSKAGTAVDEAGITRCNNCGKPTTFADLVKAEPGSGGTSGAHRSGAGSTAGSAPGYRIPPVGKASASQMASGQITGLLIGGLLALLVGVVGSALTWPRLALDDAGQLDSSGSAAGLAILDSSSG